MPPAADAHGYRMLVCDWRLLFRSAFAVYREHHKPHLCIVERNSPTPVRRRFSLTQECLSRVIRGDEGPVGGINVGDHIDRLLMAIPGN